MPRYFTIGDCAIDRIVLPGGEEIPPQFGGAAVYTAMGMRLWCPDVGIVSVVSSNYPQKWIDALMVAGIDISGIRRSRFPLGLEIKFMYNADGSRTGTAANRVVNIAQRWFPKIFRTIALRLLPMAIHPKASDIPEAFYGAQGAHITPMLITTQNEHLRATYRKVKLITMDLLPPSVLSEKKRPGGIHHLPEIALADAVLPSEAEMVAYFDPVSSEEWARRLATKGVRIVGVKLGNRGSLIYEADSRHFWQIPIYPTKVEEVTGAGDAYCGGFLVGLDETGDPVKAALYGTVSASFIVEGFGPLYSLRFTRADAETRLAHMCSD